MKGADPDYSVLNFSDNLSRWNRDMAQNVILQGNDLDRSSMKVNKFFDHTSSTYLRLVMGDQFYRPKGGQEKGRRQNMTETPKLP